jgi:hypothetical protein
MAGVKLVVILSSSKKFRGFRKALSRGTCPDGGRQARRQNEVYRDQGLGNAGWDTPSVLSNSNRRGLFPSLEALQACAQSAGGKETVAHAVKISSGGAPIFLVAKEQTFMFGSG